MSRDRANLYTVPQLLIIGGAWALCVCLGQAIATGRVAGSVVAFPVATIAVALVFGVLDRWGMLPHPRSNR